MNNETVGTVAAAETGETVDKASLALVPVEKVQGGFAVLAEEYGLRGMLPGQLRAWLREHFPELKGNALTGAVSDCVAGYRTESIRHATQEYVKALRAGGVPAGRYTRGGRMYSVRVEIPRKREDKPAMPESDRIAAKVGKRLAALPVDSRSAILDKLGETVNVNA